MQASRAPVKHYAPIFGAHARTRTEKNPRSKRSAYANSATRAKIFGRRQDFVVLSTRTCNFIILFLAIRQALMTLFYLNYIYRCSLVVGNGLEPLFHAHQARVLPIGRTDHVFGAPDRNRTGLPWLTAM